MKKAFVPRLCQLVGAQGKVPPRPTDSACILVRPTGDMSPACSALKIRILPLSMHLSTSVICISLRDHSPPRAPCKEPGIIHSLTRRLQIRSHVYHAPILTGPTSLVELVVVQSTGELDHSSLYPSNTTGVEQRRPSRETRPKEEKKCSHGTHALISCLLPFLDLTREGTKENMRFSENEGKRKSR